MTFVGISARWISVFLFPKLKFALVRNVIKYTQSQDSTMWSEQLHFKDKSIEPRNFWLKIHRWHPRSLCCLTTSIPSFGRGFPKWQCSMLSVEKNSILEIIIMTDNAWMFGLTFHHFVTFLGRSVCKGRDSACLEACSGYQPECDFS